MDLENFAFSSFSPNGFNSYDPEDSYDPESSYDASMDYADKSSRVARRASRTGFTNVGTAQLDIVVTSNMATESPRLELFNAQRSIGYTNNTSLFISPAKIVSSAYESDLADQQGPSPANTTRAGHIYWCSGSETPAADGIATAGALRIYEGTGVTGAAASNKFVQIQCRQIPYKTLLEATKVSPFLVNKTRISVTGASSLSATTLNSQFDYDYTHVTNTFLGAVRSNPISPRSYFNPNQFQTNVVDLPVSYLIDGEKGINYQLLNGGGVQVTTTITLFISKYDKVTNGKNAL